MQPKKGNARGYDGFKKVLGTKIHVAVDGTGLPLSILTSPANEHDSIKFTDVVEDISECLDEQMIEEIAQCYADKGYDTKEIRRYLESRNIAACIPHKFQNKTQQYKSTQSQQDKICGGAVLCMAQERIPQNQNQI